MKQLIPVCLFAAALGVSASAQDSTVKTDVKVKADDAKTVFMRGCLTQNSATGHFELKGASTIAGDDLKAKTEVKTDVDDNKTTIEGKSTAKLDDAKGPVGTSGVASVYEVTARQGVDLAQHVGHQVTIAAVMVPAGKGDADVKIDQKTNVDRDDARDSNNRTTTKVEIDKTSMPQLAAVSVTPTGASCN